MSAIAARPARDLLAANIVRLRRVRDLSQEALAWEAGVSRSYMAKIETGRTCTGLDIIARLAEILGVEPMELLRPLPEASPRRGRSRQRGDGLADS
jgi:transcriptional regulator with XRE-family HTH domain